MPAAFPIPLRPSRRHEPVWEMLAVLPAQGEWTEHDYLQIVTKRVVELVGGCLEIPPMPDSIHQALVMTFMTMLNGFPVDGTTGVAVMAAFKLKIPNGNWRAPDVVYLSPRNFNRCRNDFWDRADLVVEIVGPDRPRRDYVDKRLDYAVAGVPEYWIVDPLKSVVTVLALDGGAYHVAQVAVEGDAATSVTLPGFQVDVSAVLSRARD